MPDNDYNDPTIKALKSVPAEQQPLSARQQVINALFGAAGAALPVGKAALGAAGKALGGKSLGMFIGPMAKRWNMPNQLLAASMERKAFSPESIFDATKTFRGHEGNWRQEISDQALRVKPLSGKRIRPSGNIQHFAEHPELFENYPETANLQVKIDPSLKHSGMMDFDKNLITLGGKALPVGLSEGQQAALLHEAMHKVQGIEGWQSGASYDDILKSGGMRLEDLYNKTNNPEILRQLQIYRRKPSKYGGEAYMRVPGEVEARNVENRFRLGQVGAPNYFPMTEDPDAVRKALFARGYQDIDPANPYSTYPFSLDKLPNDLRIMYDRTPRNMQENRPVFMKGSPTYPWKTEDRPPWLKFDYSR